jgi:hypothetical protein
MPDQVCRKHENLIEERTHRRHFEIELITLNSFVGKPLRLKTKWAYIGLYSECNSSNTAEVMKTNEGLFVQ